MAHLMTATDLNPGEHSVLFTAGVNRYTARLTVHAAGVEDATVAWKRCGADPTATNLDTPAHFVSLFGSALYMAVHQVYHAAKD